MADNNEQKKTSVALNSLRDFKKKEESNEGDLPISDEKKNNQNLEEFVDSSLKLRAIEVADKLISSKRHVMLKKLKMDYKKTTGFNNLKILDTIIFLIVAANLVIMVLANNLFTEEETDEEGNITKEANTSTDLTNYLRIANLAIVSLIEILIVIRYCLILKSMRDQHVAAPDESICSVGLFWFLILEMVILAVLSPPYIDGVLVGTMLGGVYIYSYDSILTLVAFLKLYYFFRVASYYSLFTKRNLVTIAENQKVNINFMFTFKSQLQRNPFLTLSFAFIAVVLLFSFTMRTFEYGYVQDPNYDVTSKSIADPNLKSHLDSFWLITITMTTVGYGDLSPNTHAGRFIAFLASIFGMIIMSLMIAFLSTHMEFNSEQKKAYALILKREGAATLKRNGASVIKMLFRFHMLFKKGNKKESSLIQKFQCLMHMKNEIKKFYSHYKTIQAFFLPSDKVLSGLEKSFNSRMANLIDSKETLDAMKEKTFQIIEDEVKINNAMKNINILHNNLVEYLISKNRKFQQRSKTDNA